MQWLNSGAPPSGAAAVIITSSEYLIIIHNNNSSQWFTIFIASHDLINTSHNVLAQL